MRAFFFIMTFFAIIFCISSCNDKSIIEKTYFQNGNIKTILYEKDSSKIVEEFDSFGNLKFKFFVKNDKKDSLVKYYQNGKINFSKKILSTGAAYSMEYDVNGNLEKEGLYIDDTVKAWWWKFYKKNKLSVKREYVIVCEDNYLNQVIALNEKNDTVFDKSTFFKASKSLKDDALILDYNVKSLFEGNKIDLIILKDTKCEEKPDTVIALPSNKGKITLNKKYADRNAFFFDYVISQNDSLADAPYNMKHHKKYFDMSKI